MTKAVLWVGLLCSAAGFVIAGSLLVDAVQVVGMDSVEPGKKTTYGVVALCLLTVAGLCLAKALPPLLGPRPIKMPPVLNSNEALSQGQGIPTAPSVASQAEAFLAQRLEFTPRSLSHPDVLAMIERVQEEYVAMYGGPDSSPISEHEFAEPLGAFFVVYAEGVPAAMGGWRFRDQWIDGVWRPAEIKRMYVAPEHRGQGLSAALLAHLEQSAREAGAERMVLETGAQQHAAISLYRSRGYVDGERFGYWSESPNALYLSKPLGG